MAGNVNEWLFNSNQDKRYHLGGNFREPSYWYNRALSSSPWERSELYGFRCIKYVDDTLKSLLNQSYDYSFKRDFTKESPVSDEVFSVYLDQFKINNPEINPEVIQEIKNESWAQQVVSFDVPYVDIPLKVFIYIPEKIIPPYQVVVYYPHGGAFDQNSTENINISNEGLDFFVKSGRVLVYPILYRMFGRIKDRPNNYMEWKQAFTFEMLDFKMVIEYLNSREDMDLNKLAYFGISWGGEVAPIALNVDKRFKIGILSTFALSSSGENPEFDIFNYLPRVKIPMLLMGGKYDQRFLYEEMQLPYYNFLGTPEEHKKFLSFESTHYIPRNDLINESLSWLDKYFGPVITK